MSPIHIEPLNSDLPFGSRISGVTWDNVEDQMLRTQIREVFESRGLIVFEAVEPTDKMQLAISSIFGPLKDHPVKSVRRVDNDAMPGVIQIGTSVVEAGIVEVDGRTLSNWLPWHFDHCYNDELNRAGVLRALHIAPEGGLTGFVDGIQAYNAMSPALLEKIEGLNIVHTLDLAYARARFGMPKGFREIRTPPGLEATVAIAKTLPRAIHPAVWTRASGEKVLHISPWGAVGIEGREDAEGDALYAAVCEELLAKMQPYFHRWSPTDMLVWDNWRMMHAVDGNDPKHLRIMHRTTIKGDYGLGYFENGSTVRHAALEMAV